MPGPAPTRDSDPLRLIGTLVDERYRVRRLIGRGGMGCVYEADHERLKRPIALKVLSQVLARRRFEREALATAKIDHPNSVRLFDFGQLEDGTLYLAMELLEGQSLDRVIVEGGPIAPVRALRICRDILGALGQAHRTGVVHRDIKPRTCSCAAPRSTPVRTATSRSPRCSTLESQSWSVTRRRAASPTG